jgi:hypothetical protein
MLKLISGVVSGMGKDRCSGTTIVL